MTIDEIIAYIEQLGAVLIQRPESGDGTPEIAWGDVFVYYAPDGRIPAKGQPFATIVTKDYPGDTTSGLNRPGAFRVNISAGKDEFVTWTGHEPRDSGGDASAEDTVLAHPVYGSAAWLAVVNPGPRSRPAIEELLGTAHARARARYERRSDTMDSATE